MPASARRLILLLAGVVLASLTLTACRTSTKQLATATPTPAPAITQAPTVTTTEGPGDGFYTAMIISGVATRAGAPLAGSRVEAIVGGSVCGRGDIGVGGAFRVLVGERGPLSPSPYTGCLLGEAVLFRLVQGATERGLATESVILVHDPGAEMRLDLHFP